MKGNGPMTGKMLNGNWVLKRKRRKRPSGIDKTKGRGSNTKTLESPSSIFSIQRLKSENTSDHSSSKIKGDDGYYYECVICDVGGNLICCESCPRTYHLQCLDPPLKNIPTGKWECPKCCAGREPSELIANQESISKRARTKIRIGKSKTDNNKKSQISGSSSFGKKISSSKEKPSPSRQGDEKKLEIHNGLSCRNRDGSVELSSSNLSADDGKKSEASLAEPPAEMTSGSHAKKVLRSIKIVRSKLHKDASETKDELSSSKRVLKPVIGLISTGEKSKKRTRKLKNINSRKKCRTDKGRDAADTSKEPKSQATCACPRTSKQKVKHKIVDPEFVYPSEEDAETHHANVELNDEIISEDSAHPSNQSHGAGKVAVKLSALLVDQVLGCRVQKEKKISLNTPVIDLDVLPLENQVLGDPSAQTEGCPPNIPLNVKSSVDFTKGSVDIENHSVVEKNGDSRKENLQVYRRSVTKRLKEGTKLVSVGRVAESSGSKVLNGTDPDDTNSPENIADTLRTSERSSVDNSDSSLERDRNSGVLKNSGTHSDEVECSKEADKDIIAEINCKNIMKETIKAGSASSSEVTVVYEFLVKWVGKSNIHNTWIPESELKVLAKRKLDNYKAKNGLAAMNLCEDQWKQPQRIVALRHSQDGSAEVYVKWKCLSYADCTWERMDELVICNSFFLIDRYYQFERHALEKATFKDSLQRIGLQQSEIVSVTEQPKELKGGSLFPHQLEALNWLRKCWHKSKNVILTDEMGLGKTVSACAFLSSLYCEFNVALPCLVLVPLSTMPNWMSEFALWSPNLNVVEYHGSSKARATIRYYEWSINEDRGSQDKKLATCKFDVLLTTYEIVLADASYLRGVQWEVLVVDEGHRLKNSGSKLFGLLNTFCFQHRLLLTGTPLQNNIGEMYNLLNFLQPASFPSQSSFEENFNDLTTAEKVEELKKLVAPHMLRRLKKDAMQNIPPKTERVVPVELSSIQAEYYRAMLTKNYQILRNIGKGVPQQSMLNIVMQLRKVCNHPYLIPGTEPESGSIEFLHDMRIKASAKLTLLHSMLKLLHKDGHRVLIFSQMTKLLDILEDYLTVEFGPKTFERVDGSVSVVDRQAAIVRFNQDKSRFVFLLSTRSCGLGINLATADTVIIYDSDFNPHADIQAMNRAHRIGQSNRLLVYRLVVRASVEERILQLAKKKLMLDQLFVTKEGSQKEVEDILRWGTEELFRDSSSMNGKDGVENNCSKDKSTSEIEHKNKRRTGSLGDVYKDRCNDGSSKIVWDENAIQKLLDRSNLQSSSPDNTEMELENDMLGSVKWNDEPTEEQPVTGPLPMVADDTCTENSEKKVNNLASEAEENDWDRLLRVRWEKYQIEKEAALGRGKRQRKAVSYREAYAPHTCETLSENGAEEEQPEPEPEPVRIYSAAGRAWKEKYARLRARQKARVAKTKANEACGIVGLSRREELPQLSPQHILVGNQMSPSTQPVEEKPSVIDLEGNMSGQTPEKIDPTLKLGKMSKQKSDVHQDPHMKPSGQFPFASQLTNQPQGTNFMSSAPSNSLLPVLGLYAPNANRMDASQRNFSKSYSRQKRLDIGPEFPFPAAPPSGFLNEVGFKGRETISGRSRLPDLSSDASLQQPRIDTHDSCLPSHQHPVVNIKGKGRMDDIDNPGASFSSFREKLLLPKLPLDESLLPRYPYAAKNLGHAQHDLFPSLSLGSKVVDAGYSNRELQTMPLLPNVQFHSQDVSKYNQREQERPLSFGLGQIPPSYPSFPESHRKVLQNIVLRTGSGSNNLLKRKSKMDIWSEDELDCLWIGVRRHGRGNWDAMLQDPKLKFSKFRTAEDLMVRWEEEQLNILDGPGFPFPKPLNPIKPAKSSLPPSISDGIMMRALHGSKLSGLPKYQGHITDMKLGFGDMTSSLLHAEPSNHIGLRSDHIPPHPPWSADKSWPNFSRDLASCSSDGLMSSSNIRSDTSFLMNSLGGSALGLLGLNSSSISVRGKENESSANRFGKSPIFLDRPVHILSDLPDMGYGESTGSALQADFNKVQNVSNLKGKEVVVESNSSKSSLPHWLREAVSAPAKTLDHGLPPYVSAIAQSVRLLYGEDKTTIPPFVAPGPPPSQPKDPRRSLKRKKKQWLHKMKQFKQDVVGTSSNDVLQSRVLGETVALMSAVQELPFPELPASAEARITSALQELPITDLPVSGEASTTGHPLVEPELSLPPLNLNLMNLSSSSADSSPQKETAAGLSPSAAVLQPANSCAVPGPLRVAAPSSAGNTPAPTESVDEGRFSGDKDEHVEDKHQNAYFGALGPIREPPAPSESRDSSKTHSDPVRAGAGQVDGCETSSEGTVSDHRASDQDS